MTSNNLSENSLIIARTLNAPIELIWQMWSDPDHFKQWYGPQGATIPVAEFDVRVGGRRFVGMEMNTPNGLMQMWFAGEHLAVDQPELLSYSESMSDERGNVQSPSSMGMPEGHPATTEVLVELRSMADQTQMTLTHIGIPPGSPGEIGWSMALDKLATYADAQAGR